MRKNIPLYFKHYLMKDGFGATIANTLGDIKIKHCSQSIQKLIFWAIVTTLHNESSLGCLDKEHSCPSMLRYLKRFNLNYYHTILTVG